MGQKTLSTGVLLRSKASINAHVDVVNLSQSDKRKVKVEIFDWGVDQLWSNPKPVPVSPSGSVTIGPHTLHSFLASITQSTTQPTLELLHYEIRITVSDIKNVVVNCFAHDSSGKIIMENSVLHNGLVEIT